MTHRMADIMSAIVAVIADTISSALPSRIKSSPRSGWPNLTVGVTGVRSRRRR